jgi:hypothetical protein
LQEYLQFLCTFAVQNPDNNNNTDRLLEYMKKFFALIIFVLAFNLLQAQIYDTVNVFQTSDTLICGADTVVLDAGPGFESYSWNTGATTRTINVGNAGMGTYSLAAVTLGGQLEEAECTLTIARIQQESDSLCYKDTLFLIVEPNNLNYVWATGNPADTQYYYQTILTHTQTYSVEISNDHNSCVDTIRLDMYPRIYVEFEQNQENKGCPGGDCKGQLRVYASGGTGALDIVWDTPNVDPGDSSYAIGLCEGFTGVHIYDEIGCRFDTNFYVEVWEMPEIEVTPDTTTYIQDPVLTFWFENLSEDSITLNNYFWTLRNGISSNLPNPTFSFPNMGEHKVRFEYTTMNGCVDSSIIVITVASVELLIPNVFTPNGDGANDTFIITIKPPESNPVKSTYATGSGNYQPINDYYISNQLVIFNRWGDNVFEATNYNNDWDGGNLPAGTYFYVLKCQGSLGEDDFQGAVTILR